MIMRRLISLSMLALMLGSAQAQDISRYEYWTDDNYAGRSVVTASDSDITLGVSTDGLSAGIHFLNFRAAGSDGTWGNYYRYLYYIPTLRPQGNGEVAVEYWLDDNLTARQRQTAQDSIVELNVNISPLAPGIHFFNCTPMTSTDGRGSSERYVFYVPQPMDNATVSDISGYEYWLDDDYQGRVVREAGEGQSVVTVSLDGMASGIHYFNCRALNKRGEYGNPVREMFYVPDTQKHGDATLAAAEYWLDDDYADKVNVTTGDTEQAFSVDISSLGSGVHYFNYRAIDSHGHTGSMLRQMFYMARSTESEGGEPVEYEYWIDDDEAHKVTGKDTGHEYAFAVDVSTLPAGTHTFNFRAKNLLDEWGATYTETFELTEVNAIDCIRYTGKAFNVYNLNGIKVKDHATVDDLKSLPRGIYIYGGKKILVP